MVRRYPLTHPEAGLAAAFEAAIGVVQSSACQQTPEPSANSDGIPPQGLVRNRLKSKTFTPAQFEASENSSTRQLVRRVHYVVRWEWAERRLDRSAGRTWHGQMQYNTLPEGVGAGMRLLEL